MYMSMVTTSFSFAYGSNMVMGKQEYIDILSVNLSKFANNKMYINISQLANALGIARETAAQLVFKLRYIPNGREKLYLVNDVATQLYYKSTCDSLKGA